MLSALSRTHLSQFYIKFPFKDRLNKVHQSCLKETAKRRTLLEPSPTSATPHLHDSPSGSQPSTSATGDSGGAVGGSITKSLAFQ